jgi:hypothetical protein
MKQFAIPRNRIFNSRSKEFLPEIMRETNGRGVDIVLNSWLESCFMHPGNVCQPKEK